MSEEETTTEVVWVCPHCGPVPTFLCSIKPICVRCYARGSVRVLHLEEVEPDEESQS